MHDIDWLDEPVQDLPPCAGAGALHFLYRCRTPLPQVRLQEPHPPQPDQLPCTLLKRKQVKQELTACQAKEQENIMTLVVKSSATSSFANRQRVASRNFGFVIMSNVSLVLVFTDLRTIENRVYFSIRAGNDLKFPDLKITVTTSNNSYLFTDLKEEEKACCMRALNWVHFFVVTAQQNHNVEQLN